MPKSLIESALYLN